MICLIPHHRAVATCFLGIPWNSLLVLHSKNQITTPIMRKEIVVTSHIIGVNGFQNAQTLEFDSLTEATTTSRDSIYGCVKSTILVRSVVIAMSPITASKTYMEEEN